MGLKVTPIVFTPQTLIKSADMNSNFTAVTTATNFDGSWQTSNNSLVFLSCQDTTVTNISGSSAINVLSITPATSSLSRKGVLGYISGGTLTQAIITNLGSSSAPAVLTRVLNNNNGPYFAFATVGSLANSSGTSAITVSHGWPGTPAYIFTSITIDSQINPPNANADYASVGTVGSTTFTYYSTNLGGGGFTDNMTAVITNGN